MNDIFEIEALERLIREFTKEIAGAANHLVQLAELSTDIRCELRDLVHQIEDFDREKIVPTGFHQEFSLRDVNASKRMVNGA